MNAAKRGPGPSGLVVIDKPSGMTSHDVVGVVRRTLQTRKVGHAGTLDPDATGVLVVGVGKATRLLRFITGLPKTYVGTMVLGAETDTLDAGGQVTATYDMDVSIDEVREAARAFVGEILQVPPMVSALKVDGKRLHELAREGIEVEREARPVTVYSLDVEPTGDPGRYLLTVECGAGTYIRSLAADLGRALGGGAHLDDLRRTAIGPHTLEAACAIDELVLEPVRAAVAHMTQLTADHDLWQAIAYGRLRSSQDYEAYGPPPWAVLSPDGEVLAIVEPHSGGRGKPSVVLTSPDEVPGQ